jgi:cobalt-zinc-cadmium efflux system membrane fusion protein
MFETYRFLSLTRLILVALALPLASTEAATLSISPEQSQRLGIMTAPVTPAITQTTTSILGHVMPAMNARVPVPAPFSGTVVAIEVLEGAEVEAGDTLAIVASRNVRDAHAQLQSLQVQHQTAAAAAARSQQLSEEGIVSRARAEEDAARAAAIAAEYSAVREILSRTSSVDGSADMYRLVAPVSGRVASVHALPGGTIEEMEAAILLDTGDELWIEARLPASEIGKVGVGDAVLIEGRNIRGQVVGVGRAIDPITRSAVLRAVVPSNAILVSGDTVRVSVLKDAHAESLNVPRSAVVRMTDGFAVFVARQDGFDVVPVRVVATGATEITFLGPVEPTASVAISGLSELKALALQD